MPFPFPSTLTEMRAAAARAYRENVREYPKYEALYESADASERSYYRTLRDRAAFNCLLTYCVKETLQTIVATDYENLQREIWVRLRTPLLEVYTYWKDRYKASTDPGEKYKIPIIYLSYLDWVGKFVLDFYVDSWYEVHKHAERRRKEEETYR